MSNWNAIKAQQQELERRAQYIAASVGWTSGMPLADPDPSLYANQAALMQSLSWIYSAVSVVSESAASLAEYEVFEQDDENETAVVNHEFERLLRHPNDIQFDSQFEFIEATAGYLKLNGNAYLYLNSLAEDLPPAEIFVLRPDRMTVVPDKEKFVGGYFYTVEGVSIFFEPWEVLHLKKPHPQNDWYGLSAIESLSFAAESDFNMAKWNRNFFDKGFAKPQGALAYADTFDDGDWERMKLEAQQEYGGVRRRMLMLRGVGTGGVQWMNMGWSQKDMEFLAGRQFTKEEIWTTLAPGLLQLMDKNVTEANSTAGEKTLREYVLWPMLVRIAQKFTARVLPRYASTATKAAGKALVGRFKDIRPRNRTLELSEQEAYSNTHTIDEVRDEYYSDEPLGDERGNLLPLQVTTAVVPVPGQELTPSMPPKTSVSPAPQPNADGEPPVSQENPDDGAKAQSPSAVKASQWEYATNPGQCIKCGGALERADKEGDLRCLACGTWYVPVGKGDYRVESAQQVTDENAAQSATLARILNAPVPVAAPDTLSGAEQAPAKPDTHTGIMVALAIPESVGRQLLAAIADNLPAGSTPEPLDNLHLTLCYLGKTTDAQFTSEQLMTALRIFAARHSPLRGKIGGVGRMPTAEQNDTCALYALFDSPELPAFRQDLVETLQQGGITLDHTHGFVPHVTLAYIPVAATEIPAQLPDVPVRFEGVVHAWGGNWTCVLLASGIPTVEDEPEDAGSNAVTAELAKWERKCLRRLEEHGELRDALEFKSEALTPTLQAAIAGALEAAGDALAVKAVFADAAEWQGYP